MTGEAEGSLKRHIVTLLGSSLYLPSEAWLLSCLLGVFHPPTSSRIRQSTERQRRDRKRRRIVESCRLLSCRVITALSERQTPPLALLGDRLPKPAFHFC